MQLRNLIKPRAFGPTPLYGFLPSWRRAQHWQAVEQCKVQWYIATKPVPNTRKMHVDEHLVEQYTSFLVNTLSAMLISQPCSVSLRLCSFERTVSVNMWSSRFMYSIPILREKNLGRGASLILMSGQTSVSESCWNTTGLADSGSVANLSVMCTDLASVTIPSERVMTWFASRGTLEQTYTITKPKYKYGQQEQVTVRNHSLKTLARFCSWAGWFESYLFPKTWRHGFPWHDSVTIMCIFVAENHCAGVECGLGMICEDGINTHKRIH